MLSGNLDLLDIQQALMKVQPNDHLCLIHKTQEELENIIRPFIAIGLERNEKCIYIGNRTSLDSIRQSISRDGLPIDQYEAAGQLRLIDSAALTNRADQIVFDKMLDFLQQESEKALAEGYSCLRVSDDLSWAIAYQAGYEELLYYEARLNRDLFSKYNCILLCQYNQSIFDARTIREVLTTHPIFIRHEKIYINSYYIPTEIQLGNNKDEYQLEEWLGNMERERLYGDRMGFLADVLQRSSQPFVVSLPDGKIITCNPAFCDWMGYTLDELRAMKWNRDLHSQEQGQIMQKVLLELNNTGRPQYIEREYRHKNGQIIPGEEFVHQVCDQEGRLKFYCCFITDISERKRNEKAIRESEEMYRALFTSMHEGFMVSEILYDQEGIPYDFRFLEINPSFEYLSGIKREVNVGKTVLEVDADMHNRWIKIVAEAAQHPVRYQHYSKKLDKIFEAIAFSPGQDRFAILAFDITKLKQLEKELQEQLHFYQNFTDSIPTPAFYRDTDGRFQFCNTAFENAIGLSRQEIIGQSLYKVLPRDLANKYREMDLTLLSTSGVQCYDWEFQYADGHRHDVIFNKAPLSNTREEFIGVVGTIVDITKRKSTEKALRLSEERFRNIFSQSPFGIALYDSNGILVDMNRACREILGIKDIDDVKKLTFLKHIDLPDQAREKLINGELLRFELEFDHDSVKNLISTTKSGICYLECFISPLNYQEGEQHGFLFQIQDITEQKRAEQALKTSEAHLRRITENMMDMISQVDVEGIYEYVSPSHKTILGYEPEQLYNTSLFNLVHPDDISMVKTFLARGLSTRSFNKTDFRYCCADGTYLNLETVGNVLYDDDGNISGAVLGTRDISESKKMERELARLDQLRVVGEMAASIAHEIRNPMTTVRGFLQVLGDKDECRNLKEYFDLMIEELDSANAIITEFLSLAKDKAVYFSTQDLNNVIKAIHPLIAADAIKSDKQVILELADIPNLYIDAKEIRQLILNLTRNGLESMDPGGYLTIRTAVDEQNVILSIEDQGHGIETHIMDKIGTPFFTTKDQGTGLGLAICYSIAARHKAVIDVKSSNHGSTFSVIFKRIDQLSEQDRSKELCSERFVS